MATAKKTATKTPTTAPAKKASPPAAAPTWDAAPAVDASGASQDDKTMGLLSHLLGIFTGFVGPLILWLVKKDQSPFVERHAREALNFQITVVLASIVAIVLWIILIGVFLSIAVGIVSLVFGILATIAASKGQEYRYPFALRLVKGPAGQA